MDHLVKELNPPQREAVETTKGPVMIIAGAGSGKTRVITYRIAYIIHKEKCPPKNILALTFTNRAANEMRERVEKLLGPGSTKGLWIGTFHSNFARLLRQHADSIGFTKDFTIYDAEDSKKMIEEIMKEIGMTKEVLSPNVIQSRISMAKNKFILPEQFSQSATDYVAEKVAEIYRRYAERLRRNNALDFDDLLIKPIELFNQNPAILEFYQQRFEYLMIDEYQDTNRAQYMVAKMLSARHRNICVVGDDAQSIYSWRGADISNILGFQKDYPEATICRLEENYRCTKNILRVANAVIKNNKERLDKTLYTINEEGDPVRLMVTMDEGKEAEKVAMAIRELKLSKGFANKDFAVFYRTNAQSRVLEQAMRDHGVAYKIVGGVPFFNRKEIKDVRAYLHILLNEHDETALRRIINTPARGIGDTSISKLQQIAKEEELSLYEVICRAVQYDLQPRLISALVDFRMLIEELRDTAVRNSVYEIVAVLYRKTRMLEILKNENTAEANARYDNLQEFLSYARYFSDHSQEDSSLAYFLETISLVADRETDDDIDNKVTLMTVHSAKGLEFPVVFVTGMEERLFPLNPDEPKELEEERRLFYVALTRAQKRLFVSYAKSRYRFGESKPALKSRFIDELDGAVVEMEGGRRLDEARMNERERSRYQRDAYSQDYDTETYNENWRKPQPVKPSQKFTAPAPAASASSIVVGMKVQHKLFGIGKVLAVQGSGDEAKVKVFFRAGGEKTLILKHANLTVLND